MIGTFKLLSNENKGESHASTVQKKCYELIHRIIESREYETTIYPKNYEFEGTTYRVMNFQYTISAIDWSSVYQSEVQHGTYIVNVEIRINES
jgi:hypothetical protein